MNVEAIRKGKNMTQQQLADKVGISRGAYANIENGSRAPSTKVAKRIGQVLGLPWTVFFEDVAQHEDDEDT